MIDGQHDGHDVEYCVAHYDDGLRLYDGHNDGNRKEDGKCEQELPIVAIGSHETDYEDDELNDEQNNNVCVVSGSLQFGSQVEDDHNKPVDNLECVSWIVP